MPASKPRQSGLLARIPGECRILSPAGVAEKIAALTDFCVAGNRWNITWRCWALRLRTASVVMRSCAARGRSFWFQRACAEQRRRLAPEANPTAWMLAAAVAIPIVGRRKPAGLQGSTERRSMLRTARAILIAGRCAGGRNRIRDL